MWIRTESSPAWRNEKPSKVVTILGVLLLFFSFFILITSAIGYGEDTGSKAHYARYYRPVYLSISYAVFLSYWFFLHCWIRNWLRRDGGKASTITVYVYTPKLNAQSGVPLSGDAIAAPVTPSGVPPRPAADIRAVKPSLLYTNSQDKAIGEMLEERNREWGDTKLIVYTVCYSSRKFTLPFIWLQLSSSFLHVLILITIPYSGVQEPKVLSTAWTNSLKSFGILRLNVIERHRHLIWNPETPPQMVHLQL